MSFTTKSKLRDQINLEIQTTHFVSKHSSWNKSTGVFRIFYTYSSKNSFRDRIIKKLLQRLLQKCLKKFFQGFYSYILQQFFLGFSPGTPLEISQKMLVGSPLRVFQEIPTDVSPEIP